MLDKYVETFIAQYHETMLWSSTDDNGDPLDDRYTVDDIEHDDEYFGQEKECRAFIGLCESFLDRAFDLHGYDAEDAGHDYALTRNHHGAGYWDRGLGDIGNSLSEMSHAFGESSLYIGGDGKLRYGW